MPRPDFVCPLNQIEAQRKRVRFGGFGEEEQRNGAKFSGGCPETE